MTVLGIQQYRIEFRDEQEEFPPTQDELVALSSERIVVADSECIIEAGFLEIINDGVSKNPTIPIEQYKNTIGSKGSTLFLQDETALKDHANVYISYGRMMIEPNRGPVYINDIPIVGITPVYPQDEIRIASTSLRFVLDQRQLVGSMSELD